MTESAVLVAHRKDQAAALTVNFYCFSPLCIKQSRHHSRLVAVLMLDMLIKILIITFE